jgi:hypothetical protein
VGQGRLPVTCRRGVAWAFARERREAIAVPSVAVLHG